MDLDEYIWRSKKSSVKIARAVDCSANTIGFIKRKESTCGLFIALKLVEMSNGEITFPDLLNDNDREKYKKWKFDKTMEIENNEKWISQKETKEV